MTRLVVHMGAQQTTSPGFHKSLYASSAELLKHGVLLPMSGRQDPAAHAVRHQLLAWSFDPDGDHPYDPTVWDELTEEIAASPAGTVLVTSELLAAVAADPATAPLLRERLHALSDDVTLVFLARDQLELLNDLYCQRVRTLELTCDFDTYLSSSPDVEVYDLTASFRRWYDDRGVRFVAMPWDPGSGADALPALLSLAGVDVPAEALAHSESEEEPLGPVGLEANRLLGSYLRGRFPDFRYGEAATRRLRRKAATVSQTYHWDRRGGDGPESQLLTAEFWGWTHEQAARWAARYAPSNETFARAAWGGSWTVAAPVDRDREVAELVELDPMSVNQVHRYLIGMEEAFERFRRREAAA